MWKRALVTNVLHGGPSPCAGMISQTTIRRTGGVLAWRIRSDGTLDMIYMLGLAFSRTLRLWYKITVDSNKNKSKYILVAAVADDLPVAIMSVMSGQGNFTGLRHAAG